MNTPMSFNYRSSLVFLLLVVLVPTLIIGGIIYNDRYQMMERNQLNANLELAKSVGQGFDAFVQGVLQIELAIGIAASAICSIAISL